jgi:hypothetical protein
MGAREAREEAKRKRAEDREKARLAQEETDFTAIAALEEKHGDLHTLRPSEWKPGTCAVAAYRPCSRAEYKRCAAMSSQGRADNRAEAIRKAHEQLGESCLLYPTAGTDAREAFLEAYPGAAYAAAQEVVKIAELEKEEEGKG